MDVVQAVAAWRHSLATVILLCYYALLALVVVPVLPRAVNGPALGRAIPAIERRALPLTLASIGVFLVTGTYLLLTEDRFLGLGHVFGNAWSTLIVIKHVMVIALIGIGFSSTCWSCRTSRPLSMRPPGPPRSAGLRAALRQSPPWARSCCS